MAASKKNMNLNPLYSSLAKHGIFIDSTGQLQAWGDNQVGHLGIGNTQSQREPRPVVLTHPSRPGELIKVLSVSAGMEHTLLLSTEYEVFGWGSNGQGQLGVGAQTPASAVLLPIPMPTNKRIVQIACGSFYSAVLTEDGLVYTWGSNSCGQLGMRGVTGVGMSNRIQNYPVQVNSSFKTSVVKNTN
jgi:RCC1 and BTB domain-containing protein